MTIRSPLVAAVALLLGVPSICGAQVPADLRTAVLARATAVARADVATWDRLTSDRFTVTGNDGRTLTKAERIAQLKAQQPGTPRPLEHERYQSVRNGFVHNYQVGNNAILEVWTRERGGWRVASVQVTTVEPDSATAQQAIDVANTRFLDALKRGDAATLAANYADYAVLMPPNMAAWEGHAAISQGLIGFLAQFSVVDARLTTKDLIIVGDFATERGTFAWTLHPKSGAGADIVDNGKYVVVWQHQADGSWKIVWDISNSDRPGGM